MSSSDSYESSFGRQVSDANQTNFSETDSSSVPSTESSVTQEQTRPVIPIETVLQREHELCIAVQNYLSLLPDVPSECLENTPRRFVKALGETLEGYNFSPREILSRTFEESYDEIILLTDISFNSVCEHHLSPFSGTVSVGYLPGKVVGVSKLARVVDCFSRRLQIQERMTRQIAEVIQIHLDAKGVAVVVRGVHSCMSCRGVRKSGAEMVTSCMLGAFRDEPSARNEFLLLCNKNSS